MTVQVAPWEGATPGGVEVVNLPENLERMDHQALLSLAAGLGVMVYGQSSKEAILSVLQREAW